MGSAVAAYEFAYDEPVRTRFEEPFFARMLAGLLAAAGGGRLLDLGCCDGRAAALAGPLLEDYAGVDFRAPASPPDTFVLHDLRRGLGPVGSEPYDVYFGGFGIGSHLAPAELLRLLRGIAAHGRSGSVVAIECLGLYSLEWPRLWQTAPGRERELPYRLGSEVIVHPWSPRELRQLFTSAGLEWVGAHDRTVQAGPKAGERRYWRGVPRLRIGLEALLSGDRAAAAPLAAPLPPLPAHPAAVFHHSLAARRARALADGARGPSEVLAEAVWALEPATETGCGHGLVGVGRVAAR